MSMSMMRPRLTVLPMLAGFLLVAPLIAGRGAVSAAKPKPEPEQRSHVSKVTVDVSMSRATLSAAGQVLRGSESQVDYRWTRERAGAGWKSVMVVLERSPLTMTSARGPIQVVTPSIARIENDEDGSPVRVYGANGKQLLRTAPVKPASTLPLPELPSNWRRPVAPSAANTSLRTDEDWIETLIVAPESKSRRLDRLPFQAGIHEGAVGNLQRFMRTDGDTRTETLVDPDTAIVVETNTARNGVLERHVKYTYDRNPNGTLTLAGVRVERLIPSTGGQRGLTNVRFSNLFITR